MLLAVEDSNVQCIGFLKDTTRDFFIFFLAFEGFSISDFIHYIYFPILILEKEPVFSLLNVQC